MVDRPFISWPFPASQTISGVAQTPRTLPDRLAEVKNVLDFGATGNGTTDDGPAFQRAVNAALAQGGGTVVVPVPPGGEYQINTSVSFNDDNDFGLIIRGTGGESSRIMGGVTGGYVFDRHLATPNNTFGPRVIENLLINNGPGGCIRMGSTIGGAIRNCLLSGGTLGAITTEDAPGASSQAITIECCKFEAGSGSPVTNSRGVIMGGSGIISGCSFGNLDLACTLYGKGICVQGTRAEKNNTVFVLGVDAAGTNRGLNGFCFTGMPLEGNTTDIDFRGTVSGFLIAYAMMTGHDSSNSGVPLFTLNSQYGVRIRADTAIAGEFVGLMPGAHHDIAGVWIEDYTVRSYVTFVSTSSLIGGGSGIPWRIPTTPAGFKFIECNIDSSQNAPFGTRYAFANLPGSGLRLEGDEYDIHNANTTTIGNNVTSGGATDSGHCRVRFDGTNWVCIGP